MCGQIKKFAKEGTEKYIKMLSIGIFLEPLHTYPVFLSDVGPIS